jgi:4-diphosphocytidyl-2-C-methyl-D-erythritol kinase
MIVLREIASAKINLYLHVTGKRADGYHLLDSMVAFGDFGDTLEAIPSEDISLTIDGPFARHISTEDNSVLKAAHALRAACNVTAGAALTLHKHLPVAAGIGGGSADAAAALRLLARMWKLSPSPAQLHTLALSLGADVPACLQSTSLYMGGIGEAIEPGPELFGLAALLVNPLKPLITKDVFALYHPPFSLPARHPREFVSQDACIYYLTKTANDLEPPARQKLPELAGVLDALNAQPCSLKARMSGSGATCFALFSSRILAEEAAAHIAAAHPEWWVKAMAIG